MATERDQGNGEGVVAGKHGEAGRNLLEDRRHLSDVAGGLLDADDVIDFREALESGGFDIHAGATLDTVNNDGDFYGGGDGFVVLIESFLTGFVVVGRDGKKAVHAHGLEVLGELNDLGSVVAAGAGEHTDAAVGLFERDFDYAQMFFARERGTLARGSARHQEIDAFIDLTFYQRTEGWLIERAVFAKRSHHRGAAALK